MLASGSHLGAYEILSLIGAGGMGEVYKARDPKLNRLVAVKVLPAGLAQDSALVARFEREARAVAALSHPNVLGIFDSGTEAGVTYAVMELLEGENLREKLKGGALAPRRVLEIATELADGLGAAHAQGIVHRDIKPENIFITREGRVKILDFGLAKQRPAPLAKGLATEALSQETQDFGFGTEAGMVLGTVGYMSPEQVRGEPADHRADVFAFGVVLAEMLSGQRPFRGDTPVQTMSAILEKDPPDLVSPRGPLPPGLERLVAHCLEKRPEARFQSMQDVAFALQNLSTLSSGSVGRAGPAPARARLTVPAAVAATLGAVLVLALLLALGDLLHVGRPKGPPTFVRINHTPGTVEAAFFGPDGRTVFFSERIKGGAPEVFVLHPGSTEPVALGIRDALLVGVSATGDLALLQGTKQFYQSYLRGTLARAADEGRSLKEIQENVILAAWDGTGFATATASSWTHFALEYAGRVLLQGDPTTCTMRLLRPAPDGGAVALVVGDTVSKAEIVTYDRAGLRTVRFTKVGDSGGDTFTGLAWGPDGDLWFSELMGDQTAVWRLAKGGARSLLWRGEGAKALMDVSRDGRALLANQEVRRSVVLQRIGETQVQDVSIASGTQATGFSADGQALLLMESPIVDGGTSLDQAYLWKQGGGQSIKVARGTPWCISPDGKWVNIQLTGMEPRDLDPAVTAALREAGLEPGDVLNPTSPTFYLLFMPTGAGKPFALSLPREIENLGTAQITRDGRQILFLADQHGESHYYVMDRQGGKPRILTPSEWSIGVLGGPPLSPDGSGFIASGGDTFAIMDFSGGPARPVKGLQQGERIVAWSQDGKAVFTARLGIPVLIQRMDLASGARQPVLSFVPGDASGFLKVRNAVVAPDGRTVALSCIRKLSDLYLAEGFR